MSNIERNATPAFTNTVPDQRPIAEQLISTVSLAYAAGYYDAADWIAKQSVAQVERKIAEVSVLAEVERKLAEAARVRKLPYEFILGGFRHVVTAVEGHYDGSYIVAQKTDEFDPPTKPLPLPSELIADAEKRAEAAETSRTESMLREEWWLNHRCPISVLYGDDGEMQCNAACCMKDFKRAPIGELHSHVCQRRLAAATADMTLLEEARAQIAEMRKWFREFWIFAPSAAQLLDGWHADGTAWSEWDESVRLKLSALQTGAEHFAELGKAEANDGK